MSVKEELNPINISPIPQFCRTARLLDSQSFRSLGHYSLFPARKLFAYSLSISNQHSTMNAMNINEKMNNLDGLDTKESEAPVPRVMFTQVK